MTAVNFNYPKFKYTDTDGEPGAGYKLFTYEEGTSTKKTTWDALDQLSANTNPIILDSNGEADVWIDGNYKFVLAPPTDTDPPTSPVWTVDGIRSTGAATASDANGNTIPTNGDFEIDVDADSVPDNWTVSELTGGTVEIDSTSSSSGTQSLKFTSTGSGAGTAITSEFYEVDTDNPVQVDFSIISSNVDTSNKVEVYWYNSAQTYLSSSTQYSESAANPTTWTRYRTVANPPANAKYCKINLVGVELSSTSHSNTWFDNIFINPKTQFRNISVNNSDGGPYITSSGFDVAGNLTSGAWESIGPTGAGADNTWVGLNSVPTDADWIEVKVAATKFIIGGTASSVYLLRGYVRDSGSSVALNSSTIICDERLYTDALGNGYSSGVASMKIPVTSGVFEANWSSTAGGTDGLSFTLTGYGYNS